MPGKRLIPTVTHVIPIASGKGGVGKSTVTASLALTLAATGARVGVLDADVYGPSIPTILGVTAMPEILPGNRIKPVELHGLKIVSMGFFTKPEEAVIWRGPMLHKTVEQLLGGVEWGELDYLLVDLPPGTGDIQLSLCQMIPLTGAVIVSTPQDVAWRVAQRAIAMFKKLNAPVLGVVENMSFYVCPHCGQRDDIFGSGGATQAAERSGIPVLGQIPLVTSVRQAADAGQPFVILQPQSPVAVAFRQVTERLVAQVTAQALADAAPEPKITF